MIYELVNPSDHIEFEAKDDATAFVASLLLSPMYGARNTQTGKTLGPMLFDTGRREAAELGIGKSEDAIGAWLDANKTSVAEALASFRIGDLAQYRKMEALCAPSKRAKFKAEWHDSKRSSTNNICAAAWKMGAALAALNGEGKP